MDIPSLKYTAAKTADVKAKNIKTKTQEEGTSQETTKAFTDESDISKDAEIGFEFLNRIETSSGNKASISDYTSEYETIQKEILSGNYGKNIEKYIDLLDDAFKNALGNLSTTAQNTGSKIKWNLSSMLNMQKQHERASSLRVIYEEENKRIKQEIAYYRKKKNHQMVASLTQLSTSYKSVIENLSAADDMIQTNLSDAFSKDDQKKE